MTEPSLSNTYVESYPNYSSNSSDDANAAESNLKL